MEKIDFWECVGCGRVEERPFNGRLIEIRLKFCGRVAEMECETCHSMVLENSNWLGENPVA